MKYGFISNSLYSFKSIVKNIPPANSTMELAFAVYDTGKQEVVNHSPEEGKSRLSKAKEFVQHHGKRIMGALAITTAMAAGEATAQNAATIDPSYYKTPQTAFVIPDLPSGSDYYLAIKGGEPVYITINGIDTNSGNFHLGTGTGRDVSGSTIQIQPGNVGNWIVNYTENGVAKTIGLHTNYQADIYDRTPGSTTQGQRPETVWVDAEQQAKLSAGPNMNPTGSTTSGYYKWKAVNDASYTGGYTDSTRVVGKGTYVARTNDGTGTWTNDTIAVLEKPNLDNATRTLNFPSTTAGVLYKVYKAGAGDTWTEIPSLAFTGNGSARAVTLDPANVANKDVIKLGVQRTAATPVESNLAPMQADFTTDVVPVIPETVQFTQQNRELFRDKPVPSILYSIDGKVVNIHHSNHITLSCRQGIYIIKYKENNKVLTKKIILSP